MQSARVLGKHSIGCGPELKDRSPRLSEIPTGSEYLLAFQVNDRKKESKLRIGMEESRRDEAYSLTSMCGVSVRLIVSRCHT